ncbi:GGDEF domain-containing protein [Catellatospora sp. NPDC049609]|uniref:GGDEF domain-containing protein n=1 Tax=Catellatospora sp. NPDC049609 TaxID=3155505 RepID=UPI00344495F6
MTTTTRDLLTAGLALACTAGWAASAVAAHQIRTRCARELDDARRAAATDPLTGLPNRAALGARLHELARQGGRWSLAIADLDHFKTVNDTLGHHAGDQVLTTTARRLTETLGPDAMVARLGGDEFAIILPHDAEVAATLLRDAATAVNQPQQTRGLPLRAGLSAGVTDYTPGLPIPELFRRADTALYRAKETRGSTVAWTPHDPAPAGWAHQRRQIRTHGLHAQTAAA